MDYRKLRRVHPSPCSNGGTKDGRGRAAETDDEADEDSVGEVRVRREGKVRVTRSERGVVSNGRTRVREEGQGTVQDGPRDGERREEESCPRLTPDGSLSRGAVRDPGKVITVVSVGS